MKRITIFTMQLKTPGGIERFVSTIAKMFSKDYQVNIVANYGKKTDRLAFDLPTNIDITFLTPNQPKEISMKSLISNFKWHLIPAELKRRQKINRTRNHVFKKYLSELDANYIITDRALYNSLIGKYYHGSAQKIATDHNYHQNNQKYIRELLKSIKGFNHLVVATEELRDFYQPMTKVKCHHINNPLDHIPAKKSPLISKNLLSIGRFVPEKDFASLIDTMAIIHTKDPSIHLTVIGDGVTMPQIKKQISDLKLNEVISLPGFLDQKGIENYYYNSSLFVMTSKTEAFGLVLTEAMSYGLPCIAFDRASGARTQLAKNIGILMPNANINLMAKTILSVINDKNTLQKYQNNINGQIMQKYSIQSVKTKWNEIVY